MRAHGVADCWGGVGQRWQADEADEADDALLQERFVAGTTTMIAL